MKSFFKFMFLTLLLLIAIGVLVDGLAVSTHLLHHGLFESLIAIPFGIIVAAISLVIAGLVLITVFGAMFAAALVVISALAISGIVTFWPLLLIALVLYWIFSDSKQAKLNH